MIFFFNPEKVLGKEEPWKKSHRENREHFFGDFFQKICLPEDSFLPIVAVI